MKKSDISKKLIFTEAKKLFWTKGYSNVSLRDISKTVKLDIALISRYFGNKKKLFEETLVDKSEWVNQVNSSNIIDMFVESFMESKNLNDEVTYVKMLCMNASDPEVGQIVQKHHDTMMRKPITHQIKNKFKPINFDLLEAILIGVSITRKTLKNPSLTKLNNQEYEKILRHLITAALKYKI